MNLLDKGIIQEILSETDKSEDKDRRKNSFNAYQVYSGNQKIYVLRELARTRPNSFESYTISNISVSKMVTDKRASSYNEQPIRTVVNCEGKEVEAKTNYLDAIYTESNADRELQFQDIIFNLNRYVLTWVNYREKEDKYQLMSLHPYEFVLVVDQDTGDLLVVGLSYPDTEITQGARSTATDGATTGGDGHSDLIAESQADSSSEEENWVFWSKDQHVKVKRTNLRARGETGVKTTVEFVDIDGNPENVNPLGILPFILTKADTAVDYPTVNPITEHSITFNVQQSETLTAKNIHGSGIQVFKYPERMEDRFKTLTTGQTDAVRLPQSSKDSDSETDFDYKTSGAQLAPMMESDMNYLRQILQEHEIEGMKMDLADSNAISGISRAISHSSVQKVVERHQQIYADTEKKIFEVLKAWDRLNGTRMFSEDDRLQIVFPKPKVMISDREVLDNIEKQLELGLIEEWEKFIKIDPNLSEEDAKAKLDRIEKRRKEKANDMMRSMNGNQQERISKESEIGSQGIESGSEN